MADPTQTTKTGQAGSLPSLPTIFQGDDLYDQIMGEIEPDLVTATYKTLDEKYAGETQEQALARKERYEKAFVEYKRRFDLYTSEWNGQLRTFQCGVIHALEADDRSEEDALMSQLETAFSTI